MEDSARPWWLGMPVAVAVVVVLTIAIHASAPSLTPQAGTRSIDAVGAWLGVAAAFALLLRWVHPWLMLVVVLGLVGAYWELGYTGGPALAAGPLAVLSLGLVRPRRELYAAAGLAIGVALVAGWLSDRAMSFGVVSANVALTGGAVLAAEAVRQHLERMRAQAELRRRQQAQSLAEQQLTLARDLHDGLAHALTGIAVQASIVERTAARDPEGAADAAGVIASTSRSALADLNRIVKSLRNPDDLPHAPTRGLEEIAALVGQAEQSGLRITLRRRATDPSVQPADRQLAAYRAVQEALTNATRYAPGATVRVSLDGADGLRLTVTDDGPHGGVPASPGAGHGLLGMRERVEATGGRLDHGPRSPRGFLVEARWEDR